MSLDVRQVRQDLDLSQRELSTLLDVAHTTIGRWEDGNGSPSRLHEGILRQLHDEGTRRGDKFVRSLVRMADAGGFVSYLRELFTRGPAIVE